MTDHDDDPQTLAPDGQPPECQPAWRTDFPIDTPQDQYVARREFTKFLGLASLGFVVGQFWIIVQNWLGRRRDELPRTWIGHTGSLRVGETRMFYYPDEDSPCLLLRLDANTYVGYDQKCTHLSCAVVPDERNQCLHCPCHHGYFDRATGRPIAGPPRRPLPRIRLEVTPEGDIYAVDVEYRTV